MADDHDDIEPKIPYSVRTGGVTMKPETDPRPRLGDATAMHDQGEELHLRFRNLASEWRQQTMVLSDLTKIVLHISYQQIIGMGPAVLPLLLSAMRDAPDHWHWALAAISGEDPVPDDAQGDLTATANAWVSWGVERGYISG